MGRITVTVDDEVLRLARTRADAAGINIEDLLTEHLRDYALGDGSALAVSAFLAAAASGSTSAPGEPASPASRATAAVAGGRERWHTRG